TGDTLFVGSVGRPDLGGASAAEDLWQSLRRVLRPLPDGVEVYPAHGAGSACGGGAMSAKAASTIGFERRFNPAFRFDDKARFVDFIMQGVPPKPAAFETIVAKNRGLLPLTAAKPRPMSARAAWEAAQAGAVVLDLRVPGTPGEAHVPGALHVPMFEAVGRASELPADRPKAVVCAGGLRSSTTISALKRRVPGPWLNVTGGMAAWLKAGYGVTKA